MRRNVWGGPTHSSPSLACAWRQQRLNCSELNGKTLSLPWMLPTLAAIALATNSSSTFTPCSWPVLTLSPSVPPSQKKSDLRGSIRSSMKKNIFSS